MRAFTGIGLTMCSTVRLHSVVFARALANALAKAALQLPHAPAVSTSWPQSAQNIFVFFEKCKKKKSCQNATPSFARGLRRRTARSTSFAHAVPRTRLLARPCTPQHHSSQTAKEDALYALYVAGGHDRERRPRCRPRTPSTRLRDESVAETVFFFFIF
jgi:hypothetical protein